MYSSIDKFNISSNATSTTVKSKAISATLIRHATINQNHAETHPQSTHIQLTNLRNRSRRIVVINTSLHNNRRYPNRHNDCFSSPHKSGERFKIFPRRMHPAPDTAQTCKYYGRMYESKYIYII